MTGRGEPAAPRHGERTFLDTFRREAEARLDGVVSVLTAAKHGGADAEVAEAVFRDVHSIKGAAAMLELDDVRALAHRMESALERARGSIPPELAELLLRAAAALRRLVAGGGEASPQLLADLEATGGGLTERTP